MAMCVLRAAKKSKSRHLGATDRHNGRREVNRNKRERIDPARTHLNQRLVGPPPGGLVAEINRRCDIVRAAAKAAGKRGVVKKSSVKAVEFFLSASPSYFDPQLGQAQVGPWDRAKTAAWAKRAASWARREWGDDLLSLDLHLDETTPHIHAVVWGGHRSAPGQLSANRNFITKTNLVGYHDRYAAAVKDIGIQRATPGSEARHISQKEYEHSNFAKQLNKFREANNAKMSM